MTPTDARIRALRNEAWAARDYIQVALCDLALHGGEAWDMIPEYLDESEVDAAGLGDYNQRTARAECARVIQRNRDMISPRRNAPRVHPVVRAAHVTQHWRADNDSNGNPRRIYMVWDRDGRLIAALDEGYSGFPRALSDKQRSGRLIDLGSVNIANSEYRSTLRWAREQGLPDDAADIDR